MRFSEAGTDALVSWNAALLDRACGKQPSGAPSPISRSGAGPCCLP